MSNDRKKTKYEAFTSQMNVFLASDKVDIGILQEIIPDFVQLNRSHFIDKHGLTGTNQSGERIFIAMIRIAFNLSGISSVQIKITFEMQVNVF